MHPGIPRLAVKKIELDKNAVPLRDTAFFYRSQNCKVVANRSDEQSLGRLPQRLILPMQHTPRALIDEAISDYRLNGYVFCQTAMSKHMDR